MGTDIAKEERDNEDREIIKILDTRSTVVVHICTATVANVQICTSLEALMWNIFGIKCVKLVYFSIMHNFTSVVNALSFYF